jgi:hypothetical protein
LRDVVEIIALLDIELGDHHFTGKAQAPIDHLNEIVESVGLVTITDHHTDGIDGLRIDFDSPKEKPLKKSSHAGISSSLSAPDWVAPQRPKEAVECSAITLKRSRT